MLRTSIHIPARINVHTYNYMFMCVRECIIGHMRTSIQAWSNYSLSSARVPYMNLGGVIFAISCLGGCDFNTHNRTPAAKTHLSRYRGLTRGCQRMASKAMGRDLKDLYIWVHQQECSMHLCTYLCICTSTYEWICKIEIYRKTEQWWQAIWWRCKEIFSLHPQITLGERGRQRIQIHRLSKRSCPWGNLPSWCRGGAQQGERKGRVHAFTSNWIEFRASFSMRAYHNFSGATHSCDKNKTK